MDDHEDQIQRLDEKMDQLTGMVCTLVANQTTMAHHDLQINNEIEHIHQRGGFHTGVRLEFPHFDGDNPSSWIFKASQYFDYHQALQAHFC